MIKEPVTEQQKPAKQEIQSQASQNSNMKPKICVPEHLSSQNRYQFDDGVVIDSCFDSGNICNAKKIEKYSV